MRIDLAVLRNALDRTLAHAEEAHGGSVEIGDDYYWFIPQDQLHDPTKEPEGLTLGSLTDDWAELAAVGSGDKEPFGYVLVWASSVLRALGSRTP